MGDGGDFREKFEATQAENKAIREMLATQVAGGFEFVKPDDLQGIEPDQFQTKAQEVETARKEEADSLLRKALADRGVEGDLDSLLTSLNQQVGDGNKPAPKPVTSPSGGTPVQPRVEKPEDAMGKIKAGLAAANAAAQQ